MRLNLTLLALLVSCGALRAQGTVEPIINQTGQLPSRISGAVSMKFAIVRLGDLKGAAVATATISGGTVTELTLVDPGVGYVTPPNITISGGSGRGAAATATIADGRVVALTLTSGGSRFKKVPTVKIDAPPSDSWVTTLWSNDGTSVGGAEPAKAVSFRVDKGAYSALLGFTGLPNMTAIPRDVFSFTDARLRVWFRSAKGKYVKVLVDAPLQAPFFSDEAVYAQQAGGVPDGSLSASSIADGAVTMSKLANGSISADKLADGSISSDKLAPGSISGEKIAILSINSDKLAPGSVNTNQLANGSVTSDKLANGSVLTEKLANASVTTEKLAPGSVTVAQLAADSVGADQLIAGSITADKLSAGSVTTDKLAAGGITADKLAPGSVTSTQLAAGSVTPDKLGPGTLPLDKLPTGLLLGSHLENDPQLTALGYTRVQSSSAPPWLTLTAANQPSNRTLHTAVWTGSSLIVFGGEVSGIRSAQGGDYTPSGNTWQPLPAANAPSARANHTAVWTGTKMIVWGGVANGGETSTGAVYHLADQSWGTMIDIAAPAPRTEHTAVWAGDRMLVWGGNNPGGVCADGGGYFPPIDGSPTNPNGVWTTLPTSAFAGARRGHSAIWTGTRMIIWGGLDANANPLGTGAMLDPAGAGTWTSVPTTGAPSARFGHSVIWTGTKMIIFGGSTSDVVLNGTTLLNDGAIYDPALNTWTPLPAASAPDCRLHHGAVWTGQEMVIFGGEGINGQPVAGNAAYNPMTNSWRTLPATPAGAAPLAGVWSAPSVLAFGAGGLLSLDVSPVLHFYGKF